MLFMKVMFSKVDGVVLNHGKPVPNVVATRYFNFGWTDTERIANMAYMALYNANK